ncbi:predicted protein [Thalassiosira pseudonana CCMP1335]|uniref:Uncharacterized protein n=1 Tax=Thalassiosira pseudonana TaxID=35128 RepID=B8C683_THAPS|nr:predicted protein [Thalassiosira pseudonana CCMP1335]EED91635.1 predicted protein [Thalassiosira pseudonana CCMP1335]|mmetsp:Transcript_9448/g.21024  ORF Transcript_9448/g.21024 Transcript_9448/m.21024 type:complete len:115 (+) Transcript_9448:90-434(+)|eukprot:scaffold15436_cov221-Alexandrium_tamarense.AAC.3
MAELSSPCKRSKGEELFLVHLQRMSAPDPHPEDAEDDHDYPHPRKTAHSVGEELFNIHLKRSEGLDPDYDVEEDGKKAVGGGVEGVADDDVKKSSRGYELRSRDAKHGIDKGHK